ncbi:hypothetical protein ADK38_22680, partial [Streptomyces varsoviensis]
ALLFQNRIAAAIPGASGTPSAADDPSLAAPLAHAFGEAFWAGVVVCAAAVVVGLFLPGRYRGGEGDAGPRDAGQDSLPEPGPAADVPAPPPSH